MARCSSTFCRTISKHWIAIRWKSSQSKWFPHVGMRIVLAWLLMSMLIYDNQFSTAVFWTIGVCVKWSDALRISTHSCHTRKDVEQISICRGTSRSPAWMSCLNFKRIHFFPFAATACRYRQLLDNIGNFCWWHRVCCMIYMLLIDLLRQCNSEFSILQRKHHVFARQSLCQPPFTLIHPVFRTFCGTIDVCTMQNTATEKIRDSHPFTWIGSSWFDIYCHCRQYRTLCFWKPGYVQRWHIHDTVCLCWRNLEWLMDYVKLPNERHISSTGCAHMVHQMPFIWLRITFVTHSVGLEHYC